MRRISIRNEAGNIEAEVLPDLGGMLAALRVGGRDVLVREEGKTTDPARRVGGIPVLFPFAGKTGDDSYEIYGARYHMPKHGFAKDRPFSVKERTEHAVTLCAHEDEALLSEYYPFHHTLELAYRMSRSALEIAARIENRSGRPMPHTLGWHPYFKASNSSQLEFTHHMTVHYDYDNRRESEAPSLILLTQDWDDVFCAPLSSEFSLVNPPDGYAVLCTMDDAYQSIVVYTGSEGSACIEPWCGVPDSINIGRMVQWIPPGESVGYKVQFELRTIERESHD
jgi:galactose mutarotase-like enzyme